MHAAAELMILKIRKISVSALSFYNCTPKNTGTVNVSKSLQIDMYAKFCQYKVIFTKIWDTENYRICHLSDDITVKLLEKMFSYIPKTFPADRPDSSSGGADVPSGGTGESSGVTGVSSGGTGVSSGGTSESSGRAGESLGGAGESSGGTGVSSGGSDGTVGTTCINNTEF